MLFFSKKRSFNSENFFEYKFGTNPYWYKYAFVNLFSTVGAHIGHSYNILYDKLHGWFMVINEGYLLLIYL